MERAKNASRNVFFGLILQIYKIFLPFLMRTALIYLMGMEYVGLNSLFVSVLQVLNMAELGVGSAMVYSMYKPIAEDDSVTICALMKLYRTYYNIIGLIIAIAGAIITPFIPKLIAGSVPDDLNIYVLYLLNLSATVLSYWLFAYKNSLLMAHQRTDIISKITLITSSLQYLLQLLVLWIFRNYYCYIIIMLIAQAGNNIATALYVNKIFPNYHANGTLEKEEVKTINKRIRDLFSAKLGTVLGTSVDSIVISAFLGLTPLAVYQNYYYIMTAVVGFFIIIFNSIRAGIGNSLIVETPNKNYNDFKRLAFIVLWLATVSITCFMTLFQPFMAIWAGNEYLLPDYMVMLFCLYFFLIVMQDLSCVYKDAAGIWHEDRFRPLIAGVFNLILNILLVKHWGLSGILLSTIISYLLIAVPWVIHNLFRLVFKRSAREYIIIVIKGFVVAMVSGLFCYKICSYISFGGVIRLVLNFCISVLVSNMLLFMVYRKNELFNQTMQMVKNILKQR
ncbi:MAG TPA: polysaccharide biosynthesis protein [Clostridiaceae bacterium]|nr:polysaccharide biosynthesis protein [Clostridiaceae bacterium]